MKKIILFMSVCLLCSFIGYTQELTPDKVPVSVLKAFEKKFPAPTEVKYELKHNNYLIAFRDKGVREFAKFNPTGKWLETKTEIVESDLPKDVAASVVKNFDGFSRSEIVTVELPDQPLFYMMDLKKGNEAYKVHFSAKGVVLKKMPLTEKMN